MRTFIIAACAAAIAAGAHAADGIGGLITKIEPEKSMLEISGVAVDTSKASVENLLDMKSEVSKLQVGDKVEIEGSFREDGTLLATEIEKKLIVDEKLKGTISAIDAEGNTITVSGVTVAVKDTAEIEKADEDIPLSALTAGFPVEVEGTWTGDKQLTADTIEVD